MRITFLWILFGIAANSTAQVTPRIISPKLTDPTIDRFCETPFDHYIYLDDSVKKRNQLLVFLPGTFGKGGSAPDFNMTAAEMGYHVINLIYPDSIAMVNLCDTSFDEACYDKAREEIISGKDLVPGLEISPANSIENRLIKILQYLHKNYSTEKWGQFFNGNTILWGKIAVGGQSQGGGHAGYLAMKYKVARVLMFGSPKDYNDAFHKPAQWMYAKTKTPVNRYFAFVHTLDSVGCSFNEQLEIFKVMGMTAFGPLVDASKEIYPFKNTRTLTTTAAPVPPSNAHNSPVRNEALYKKVWEYMLTTKIQ